MEAHKIINKALLKKYGKDVAGYPFYRIVQNGKALTEKRIGKYNVYYGHIFIRSETGCLEVPKYNYIPDGIWVLERLYYTTNPELTSKRTYEPIRAFTNPKTGGYQKPWLEACIFIIESSNRGPTEVLSENEQSVKEENNFYEMLGGMPTVDGMSSGSGISLAGLDIKRSL